MIEDYLVELAANAEAVDGMKPNEPVGCHSSEDAYPSWRRQAPVEDLIPNFPCGFITRLSAMTARKCMDDHPDSAKGHCGWGNWSDFETRRYPSVRLLGETEEFDARIEVRRNERAENGLVSLRSRRKEMKKQPLTLCSAYMLWIALFVLAPLVCDFRSIPFPTWRPV